MRTVTREDFSLQYDAQNKFHFFESEDGEIFAYGHVDPQELVDGVRYYDKITDSEYYSEEDYNDLIQWVKHTWAMVVTSDDGLVDDDEEWRFQYGDKYDGEPNAFPLTMVTR